MESLPPGSPELRRQIARRYLQFGSRVPAEEIVVTSGALEALNLCLQTVTRPGDTIAIEAPAFYACLQAIEMWGLRVGFGRNILFRTLPEGPSRPDAR